MRYLGFILFILCHTNSTKANILNVGKSHKYYSIQTAIDVAQAGDTIQVSAGTYTGIIQVQKSIVLIGIDFPVLDGENKIENIVVQGKNVSISGFIIKDSKKSSSNDYAAISVIEAENILIKNNRIENAHFGIHIANSRNCNLYQNIITGQSTSEQSAGNGIHIWKSNHIIIEENTIQGHRDGIYLEFVTESLIKKNKSKNNLRYGLHFMFSHNDHYIENWFYNNGTGVAVMYTKNVHMEGNIFEQNWGTASYGILLKDISDSYLLNNKFIKNTIGIFMEGGNRIEVKNNEFQDNGWALKVQANCSDNIISNNNFQGNTFDVATNGTMVMSNFTNNYWDKYEGYDLDKDGYGDIPYHPISLYSMLIEHNPNTLLLMRSFIVSLLDKVEKAIPSLTPENLVDPYPIMRPLKL